MRKLVLLPVVFIAGCSIAPIKPTADICYSGSDVLRYNNLTLRLSPDGVYIAKLQGDIALWATAKGRWLDSGKTVELTEVETGKPGFLRTLYKRPSGWLLPAKVPGQYDYKWEPLKDSPCEP